MNEHSAHDKLRPPYKMILGTRVDGTNYDEATAAIIVWARAGESRYVCVATVNNVMEAYDSPEFQSVMNAADLVTSDGMPLVWALRVLGIRNASRVYGPDLMPLVMAAAEREGLSVGFYGATPEVLAKLEARAHKLYPRLKIAYVHAPPFRTLTKEEDEKTVTEIRGAGVRILFVGMSTPKQEIWMAAHRERLPCVMMGVGAAFDFFSGTKLQAPRWMQRSGLEWFFRLLMEPRRLWRRYLFHNPRFVIYFALQAAGCSRFH